MNPKAVLTETVSTLKFAHRAKAVRNAAHVNEDGDSRTLLRKYEAELRKLRAELQLRQREVVDAFLESIKEALQAQKNIEVRGFGTFKIRHRKTRMARNPRTGSPVEVSARPVPVFKPSKELRAMVAGIEIHELDDEEELSEA